MLEHCPQQYREMLRAAPQQARLTYAAVRGHIKEWCVVSRTYQDDGILDTSSGPSPMDVSQMKGKGKPNKGFKGKPWDKGKSKDKSSKGDGKKSGKKDGKSSLPEQFQGDCGYCGKWGHKRADCRKRIAAEGGGAPVKGGAAQQVAMPEETPAPQRQVYSQGNTAEDATWIFMLVSIAGLMHVSHYVLIDSGADEHVCPMDFMQSVPLRKATGGIMNDAQGNRIPEHGTRDVFLRLAHGRIAKVTFRVANVKNPILSLGRLIREGFDFALRGGSCTMSRGGEGIAL